MMMKAVAMITSMAISGGVKQTGGLDNELGVHGTGEGDGDVVVVVMVVV